MADITLRQYTKEIDELIEREKLDEATAHCRHILQIYPKHIDTYRLLGKAYLEAKRYGDSADIFQRVLSAIPDDFVSQIGMAIVREDEGNLDAAIWHMERAFETNPSNPAIQQEMKRLIGRRDGLEPHKVRLTRGALARMYSQGELYPQAIAELRSAVKEDPERPDLLVLLAEMYYQTEQQEEALSVCDRILENLPFCLEANRIMATLLQNTSKKEDATLYHRRLSSLNPYFAFLENPMQDPETVDADAVLVDYLEWSPGQPLPSGELDQPSWAASLEVELQDEYGEEPEPAPTGPLPSWLDSDDVDREEPMDSRPPDVPDSDEPIQQESPEEEIPEWMAEAGWAPASGEAEDAPVSFSEEEITSLESGEMPSDMQELPDEDEGELAPADIPSWLQDIAPEQEPEIESLEEEVEIEGAPWLDEVEEAELESASEEEEGPGKRELPTWMEEESPGATSTIVTWLEDRETSGESEGVEEGEWGGEPRPPSDTIDEEAVEEVGEEVPPWLQDLDLEGEEESLSPEGELPEEIPSVEMVEDEPEDVGEPAPGWLAGVAEAAASTEEISEPDEVEWTPEVSEGETEGEFEETPETEGVEEQPRTEEAPDWLRAIAQPDMDELSEITTDLDTLELRASDLERESAEDLEDQELVPEGEPYEAFEEPPQIDEGEADEFDWLRQLESEPEEEAEPVSAEADQTAEDWLAGLEEDKEEAPEPSLEEEEGPSWLAGLREGTEEPPKETPLSDDDAPDWLRGIAEGGMEEEGEAEVLASEDLEWLQDLEAPVEEGEPPSLETRLEPEGPSTEVPSEQAFIEQGAEDAREPEEDDFTPTLDWLKETVEEVTPEPSPAPRAQEDLSERPSIEPARDIDDEQVEDWLESLARMQEGELETPESPEELVSDEEAAVEEWILEERELPEEPGEGMEWLEELAEKRGLDLELEPSPEPAPGTPGKPPTPVDEAQPPPPGTMEWEATPEWLRDEAPDARKAREERLVSEQVEEEVPPAEERRVEPEETPPDEPHMPVEPPATTEAVPEEIAEEPEPTIPPSPEMEEQLEEPVIEPLSPPVELPKQAEEVIPETEAELAEEPLPEEEAEWMEPKKAAEESRYRMEEDTIPDWLKEMSGEIPAAAPLEKPPVKEQAAPKEEMEEADEPEPEPSPVSEPTPELPTEPAGPEREAEPPPISEEPVSERMVETEPESEPAPEPAEVEQVEKPSKPSPHERLEGAREKLAAGEIAEAIKDYSALIKSNKLVDHVLEDLQTALDRTPDSAKLWQTYGDALMKDDRTAEAIEAYRKGMQLT